MKMHSADAKPGGRSESATDGHFKFVVVEDAGKLNAQLEKRVNDLYHQMTLKCRRWKTLKRQERVLMKKIRERQMNH